MEEKLAPVTHFVDRHWAGYRERLLVHGRSRREFQTITWKYDPPRILTAPDNKKLPTGESWKSSVGNIYDESAKSRNRLGILKTLEDTGSEPS